MGKTSLATNIAFNVASAYDATQQADGSLRPVAGGIVAFFSLEMSSEQLATRVLSEQAEVPSSSIRRGAIGETDFSRLLDHRQKMRRLPLFIDQTGALSIAQLAARARRLKRQRGLHLIVVDYIQLMQGRSQRATQNRVQEITEITTGLKALAKELNVPVVALSQLSRGVENRDEKRPQLSDLRESGSIEQDADVVLFVYREAAARSDRNSGHDVSRGIHSLLRPGRRQPLAAPIGLSPDSGRSFHTLLGRSQAIGSSNIKSALRSPRRRRYCQPDLS